MIRLVHDRVRQGVADVLVGRLQRDLGGGLELNLDRHVDRNRRELRNIAERELNKGVRGAVDDPQAANARIERRRSYRHATDGVDPVSDIDRIDLDEPIGRIDFVHDGVVFRPHQEMTSFRIERQPFPVGPFGVVEVEEVVDLSDDVIFVPEDAVDRIDLVQLAERTVEEVEDTVDRVIRGILGVVDDHRVEFDLSPRPAVGDHVDDVVGVIGDEKGASVERRNELHASGLFDPVVVGGDCRRFVGVVVAPPRVRDVCVDH